jgi:hypothetical protein
VLQLRVDDILARYGQRLHSRGQNSDRFLKDPLYLALATVVDNSIVYI